MKRWICLLACCVVFGCAPRPMLVGPPQSLPEQELRFSAGATWTKPVNSSDAGIGNLDAAMHLPVGQSFDLALRAWSLGGGIQGRVSAASRATGSAVDIMIAPLLGISTVMDYKPEESEQFLPPLDVSFLVTAPVVIGIGVGMCSLYGGGDPVLHMSPDLFVLRAAAVLGFACPTKAGQQIAPELAVELPIVGGDELRPEDGFVQGERRHPLLAQVVRLGVAFSF